ncbi:MAG: hypothetical protein ACFFAO_14965 [Candidatus Hermodarchaeota archaeon]
MKWLLSIIRLNERHSEKPYGTKKIRKHTCCLSRFRIKMRDKNDFQTAFNDNKPFIKNKTEPFSYAGDYLLKIFA